MHSRCCLTVIRAQVAKHDHPRNKTVGLLRRFQNYATYLLLGMYTANLETLQCALHTP
jgi:hypothetical protein